MKQEYADTTRHTISLPTSLYKEVQNLLYSKFEGRVPYGAWPRFIVPLIEKELARRKAISTLSKQTTEATTSEGDSDHV